MSSEGERFIIHRLGEIQYRQADPLFQKLRRNCRINEALELCGKAVVGITETIYRGEIRSFGKTPKSLGKMYLPDDLAAELKLWKLECKEPSCQGSQCKNEAHRKSSPDEPMFPNADGGFMDTSNYRNRVLKPLADSLGIPKLNFQVIRRTIATRAQSLGSVKDIQSHLRHSRADTNSP